MNVVGHANKRIAFDIGKFFFQFLIPTANHLPCRIQPHFVADNFTEQTCPILCADGHKIGASLGIIVSL
jgi:hypothetical protein